MKKMWICIGYDSYAFNRILRIMKLSLFFALVVTMQISAVTTWSQNETLTLKMENASIVEVLKSIENQTGLSFFYQNEQLRGADRLNVNVQGETVESVLTRILSKSDLDFRIVDKHVVIFPSLNKKENTPQEQTNELIIRGIVTDVDGNPIPGVTVQVKDTQSGTITDMDGHYSLTVPDDAQSIIFSFVGMQTQHITLNGSTIINVTMQEKVLGLDEVVVVGYGTMQKKDLTGSVASLNEDDIASLSVPSVSDALQGKASGVQVISNGAPGSDATIRVRGIGTINTSDPLLVIDGVPTMSGLNLLNKDNIESIQILKDASATAIYGSRGANGVVMITTKRGNSDQSNINVKYSFTTQKATNMLDMLNASQFASLHNEIMANAGRELNPDFSNPALLGVGTDWQEELFDIAPMHDISVAYSGGNEKASFFVSGNFLDQEGIVMNTGFKRYNLQFNSDTKVFENVKFGNSLTLTHDNKYSGAYDIGSTLRALPTQSVFYDDGTYAGPVGRPEWVGDIRNPVGAASLIHNSTKGYNVIGSVFTEIEIFNDFTFKSTAGLEAKFWFDRTWSPAYDWDPEPEEDSYLYQSSNRSITWLWDNILTYKKSIHEIHDFTLMLGSSAQQNRFDFMNGSIKEFASDKTQQLDSGNDEQEIGGNASEWALMSYMGRVNYGYNDKYLVTATIRRDGSSRFGSGNKWGIFPSGSVAWRISQEDFFSNIDFVDDLKLRAGIGYTGNQEIGNYAFASNLTIVKYNFNNNVVPAVVPLIMPNPNVQWESQKQINVGFDATILNQRMNITVDAYQKNTSDMLVPMSVPISTGYSDVVVPDINAGEMKNKGIELSVSSRNIQGDFSWDTDFNISYNKNEVTSLNDSVPMASGYLGFDFQPSRIAEGHAVNEFYGYVTDGIFQNQPEVDNHAVQVPGNDPYNRTSPGDIRFKDLNSDGVIDDADRTYLGNPSPDLIFSMNNKFSWKGFDLSIFLQGVQGNEILNANRIWSEGMAVAVNQTTATLDRWKKEGDMTDIPRAVFNDPNKNTRASDRWIEDGSYLRIKNIVLGYHLPNRWINKWGLKQARVFFSGTNIYTFTNYKGVDPEVGADGIDNGLYPVTRTLSFGANITF
ncbi:TonB-dependent receptor [Thermophagus sp. OGC60D27]|uniref:TonB-dependent receptor n=1 Tax=Thermophagus sp. OGC60D27 TaxID=3458415 RepID=UPI0040384D3F